MAIDVDLLGLSDCAQRLFNPTYDAFKRCRDASKLRANWKDAIRKSFQKKRTAD
jgi:hypothetical protein